MTMCVKHAYPGLIANGIKPKACILLDPRSIEGESTHGVKRKDFRVWVPNYQKRRVPFEWMITDIPNDTVQDYHYGLKRCYIGVAPRQTQANWAITTLDGLLCGLPYILYDSDYYKNLNPDADRYKNRRQLNHS